MRKHEFRSVVGETVPKANRLTGRNELAVAGLQSQWERGNGSIIRQRGVPVATLSVNWHDGFLAIGCDGKKKGINDYLGRHFPLHQKNTQNIRYRCGYEDLPEILEQYAAMTA